MELKVKKAIADYIESLKDNDEEAMKFISSTIDYLMFHKRFLELKPHEKIAFEKVLDGGELNDRERRRLDELTNEEEKDNYIGQIARTNYFRRCAWLSYLHGEPNCDKPFVAEPEGAKNE